MIALITVNLFPVFGVLFWEWDVFPIMLVYWSENVIIGFYNVLRMIVCPPNEKEGWFMVIMKDNVRQYKHPSLKGRITLAGELNDEATRGALALLGAARQLKELRG